MPTDRSRWVVIYPDGKVEFSDKTDEWETLDKGAVQVPPHGRLIDETAARKAFYSVYQDHGLPWQNAEVILEDCKTIIPAEEDEP